MEDEMGRTFAEKILGRAAARDVAAGDVVRVEPDLVLTRCDSRRVIEEAGRILAGAPPSRPDRMAIALDGRIPAANREEAALHREIREFASKHSIRGFFDLGSGLCHHVVPESGLCFPGGLVLGTDESVAVLGAFGCLAASVDVPTAAGLWAGARWEARVPESVCINLYGGLGRRVSAKDLAMALLRDSARGWAASRAVEFHGPGVSSLRMSERMTVAGTCAATGAASAVFPADGQTSEFFRDRGTSCSMAVWSDHDAVFAFLLDFDLESLEPLLAGPDGSIRPVGEMAGTKLDQVLLGTCTNGRLDDLQAATSVLRGRKVARGTRLLVAPASRETMLAAMRTGCLQDLVEAGATILPPGSEPCPEEGPGALAPGETCLSTGSRPWRAGGPDGTPAVFVASPETAAASALAGAVTDPRGF